VFDDIAGLAGLKPGSRVLELGCGTGQASIPLARRGFEVVAVELGGGLADVARRNLASFPAVDVVNAAFETWPLPPAPFEAVLAATAFHWLDPAVRVGKAADALRPSGALAVIATHHVAGGTEQFFAEVQRCYERWMPGMGGLVVPRPIPRKISRSGSRLDSARRRT
jgi:SAM-dependent methyltransferase